VKDRLPLLVGSAFGLGLLPGAPGSFGALLGVGMHLAAYSWLPPGWGYPVLWAGFLAVCAAHFAITPWAVRYWKCKDPKNFVLDEVAGYLFVPLVYRGGTTWKVALLGFVLFRALDIAKVPPARQIDRDWDGAWGILLDDLVSALYAVLALHALRHFGIVAGL
jgi:phosphatidylglycerophosphatase A